MDPRYLNSSGLNTTVTQVGGQTFAESQVPSVWSLFGYMDKPLVSESRKDLLLEYCLISQQEDERIKNIYGGNTCDKLFLPGRGGKNVGEKMKKKKRKKERNRYIISKLQHQFIHYYRKKNIHGNKNFNRTQGASSSFSDRDIFTFPPIPFGGSGRTSQNHPWQCSLKFPGFRGRHKCGVTLLSGQEWK